MSDSEERRDELVRLVIATDNRPKQYAEETDMCASHNLFGNAFTRNRGVWTRAKILMHLVNGRWETR